jgi:hypothetical protein
VNRRFILANIGVLGENLRGLGQYAFGDLKALVDVPQPNGKVVEDTNWLEKHHRPSNLVVVSEAHATRKLSHFVIPPERIMVHADKLVENDSGSFELLLGEGDVRLDTGERLDSPQ